MAIDQAHEQANAVIKTDGGAIGITEDPSALRRWMVAGPEVSHLVAQYEAASEAKETSEHASHHEQTQRAQKVFLERVKNLSHVMTDMGNPFQEDSRDLLSLDTKDIAHASAAELIATHYEKGRARFQEFLKGMEGENVSKFYEPIKKNQIDFFRQEPVSADSSKEKIMKKDCQLFSKLFISCQNRECDLNEFFRHENHPFPAALSDGGKLHTCQKSQLAAILETLVKIPDMGPEADCIIIDGSALVNSLPPRTSKTFEDYAALDVLPTIQAYSTKYKRTDIVFDVYRPSSLKSETRSKRGRGVRRRVMSTSKVPSNWWNFLRDSDNKTEIFNFLADKITQMSATNIIIVTKEEDAASNHLISLAKMAPCSHEEADTRIFVHARQAVEEGCKSILIKANDTDVLVIAKSKGILFFHAFTGCDVVSAFCGRGKKTAWQTWDICDEASDVFSKLSQYPPTIDDADMKILENFVVMMYERSSTADGVDNARLDMFARKQRPYEAIPPTQAALLQHYSPAACRPAPPFLPTTWSVAPGSAGMLPCSMLPGFTSSLPALQ
ncbi:hypothetical protein SKAU_G00412880 [Synaphobranchus kaupii]|uniref:Uncharacterized protein n=1 Tax=Synaphobranchus kaupii TaxID=118154 RepID=A0A9Q1E862_SYNKA|nr:hypothetical protein SKAU_G00412880 [Synaphobranchus kaupii]